MVHGACQVDHVLDQAHAAAFEEGEAMPGWETLRMGAGGREGGGVGVGVSRRGVSTGERMMMVMMCSQRLRACMTLQLRGGRGEGHGSGECQ